MMLEGCLEKDWERIGKEFENGYWERMFGKRLGKALWNILENISGKWGSPGLSFVSCPSSLPIP